MMDAYTLGAFAVAVLGILALVWMILRAVTVLSLANRPQSGYSYDPFKERPPIPPPTPPPPIPPSEDRETAIRWPERDQAEADIP